MRDSILSNLRRISACIVILLICPNIGLAIVIRHDVPDRAYQELGKQFPSFVSLGNGCGGTLIAPYWVLTAKHCTNAISESRFDPSTVSVYEQDYDVAEVIQYRQTDVALLRLCTAVTDVQPAELYRNIDEANKIAVLVGRGGTGNGSEGIITDDRQLRGASNKVEWVDDEVLAFEMNSPETALDLEGVGGPGDSGGPAYIETPEGWLVAGISFYGEWNYGDYDHYTRVSSHIEWIESTLKDSGSADRGNPSEDCQSLNKPADVSP